MQRRQFLHSSLAAGAGLAASQSAQAADPAAVREFYEFRAHFVREGQQERLHRHLRTGLLPALGRAGRAATGVFSETTEAGESVVWVLIRHADASGVAQLASQLAADQEYLANSSEHLSGPKETAVYDRIETSVLAAIPGVPSLVMPKRTPRLFNLRIYESFNTASLQKKIEMFERGELDIFRRVGLTPVLFGETLSGARLPSLTYLLVFPDDDARQTAWQTFRTDSQWQTMKAIPEYADARLVSRITNKLLTPEEYSQV
jgi:hypothetical protein